MTGPGHATIATGAWPYRHGIVLNGWRSRRTGQYRYCVADKATTAIGSRGKGRNVSPKTLLGTTIGDAIKGGAPGQKVVSIAIKDRAAVLMGGYRADLALWLEPQSHRWISSSYYLPKGHLPSWVERLNKSAETHHPQAGKWRPLGASDGRSSTAPDGGLGQGSATVNSVWGPWGDSLTARAALGAINHMKLGQTRGTDLLAVSLSAHDIVGHRHGHNAREMEEMLVSADRTIAAILRAVAKRVPGGMRDVVVVLTGDHGAPPAQSYLKAHRLPHGEIARQDMARLLEGAVTKKYGPSPLGRWLTGYSKFEYFISRSALAKSKVRLSDIERVVAQTLRKHPSIEWVFTRSQALDGRWPPGLFGVQAARGWHPRRSGDVIAIPRAFVIQKRDEVSHFTGYSHDRTVPLLFVGRHVRPGVYPKVVKTVDIAPTLAFLVGVVPPSVSEGRVLGEMLSDGSH
tara:strand:+ start:100 stop:1473 length:1374 start_codon:yes stop_codon:yes gene_type:complete